MDRAQSFWYAALLSTLWEYGAEALAEPVSAQDLVATPVAGFLVDEYLLSPLRQRIRAQPGPIDWSDKACCPGDEPVHAWAIHQYPCVSDDAAYLSFSSSGWIDFS